MPLVTSVWIFSAGMVDSDRDEPGVYELLTGTTVVYIGGSNEVRRRLREHLADPPGRGITHYRIDYTSDWKRREQQLYDEYVRLYRAAPLFNSVRPAGS
jgi:hypothetical protein